MAPASFKLNSNGIPAYEDLPLQKGDPHHSAWGLRPCPTIDQDIERVVGLYFTLANFTKVIKKYNSSQSYTLSSDHAIEIVNFFFGTVFHPSGAKIDEKMAYDRGCGLIKGDNLDVDLVEYMIEEGFGLANGVAMKSRFHSMMAEQSEIDSKFLPKKVLGGLFSITLYRRLVSGDFPELVDICEGLEYYVSDKIKMGVIPVIAFKYDTPPFARIFVAAKGKDENTKPKMISSIDEGGWTRTRKRLWRRTWPPFSAGRCQGTLPKAKCSKSQHNEYPITVDNHGDSTVELVNSLRSSVRIIRVGEDKDRGSGRRKGRA
ncbi:hypothetical protein V502_07100 [Pseudogymnoascus sp. VKM F-4520 (FW-2644)]|nr:hypothetical protein V502_07100 [Pseudogymnoascus sp. VKM F-4520 (FW-2644)]